MKKQSLFIIFTFLTGISFGQIHEIGIFAGGSNFIGDIGSTNYVSPNTFGGGLVYKYNLNPRIALRGNYTYIGVKGDDRDASDLFRKQRNFNFSNSIHELAAGVEFNFLEYNIRDRKTSFTPYILAQLAVFNYKSPVAYSATSGIITENTFSYVLPVGVGIKGRLSDHLAFAFESAVRFTLKDDLDFSTDTISNLNFGGNGSDAYVFTAFSIVYTFGRPSCYAFMD